jgi:APA family basic amino acid/polyamine antiporter
MSGLSGEKPHEPALPGGRGARRSLLRVLGSWEGAAIGIGVALGAGIFRTPGYVAGFLDSPAKVLAAWAVGTVLVLGDSLVLAELATRFPRAGGWYVYIEKGLGRFPAFVYGWTYMLVVDPASSAALVVVLGEYLQSLLKIGPTAGRLAGIGLTLGLFASSLAGIRLGSRIQDALTYTKLLLLAGVGLLAFFMTPAAGGSVSSPTGPPIAVTGLLAFGLALQGVLWTFEGYANTTTMSEESIDPSHSLPRALVLGSLALGATYILVNAAYLHALGLRGLQASSVPGSDLSFHLFGGAGEAVFLILAMLAAIGSLNGAALSAPRVAYALARSGLAPEPLTRVTRLGTPDLATLWFALAWTAYAWFGSFQGLVAVSIFIGTLCNVAVTATLFIHRRRDRLAGAGGSAGVFLSPFYPFLPIAMLLCWTVFAAAVLYDQGWKVGYGLLATGVAAVGYVLIGRRRASGWEAAK